MVIIWAKEKNEDFFLAIGHLCQGKKIGQFCSNGCGWNREGVNYGANYLLAVRCLCGPGLSETFDLDDRMKSRGGELLCLRASFSCSFHRYH